MASGSIQPITLHFQNLVRVAGETIEGCVDLNVPRVRKDGIESVRIEMQGIIKTRIQRQYYNHALVYREVFPLFAPMSQSLWTSATASTGPDVLSCPFRFTLPGNLPPSFYYANSKGQPPDAMIKYWLEVVADRPGVFQRNRRIRSVFLVMPGASASEMLVRESLRQGWAGAWKELGTQDAKVRQGIWGDYSHVYATLSLPDLPSFPIAAPIPYILHVVTETKTLDRSDCPMDKRGKPLFPAPPAQSSELSQALHRNIEYAVRDGGTLYRARRQDSFDLKRSQNLADNTKSQTAQTRPVEPAGEVPATVDEPEWVPKDEKDRGIWRRSVRFASTLDFPFAPTSRAETLNWVYTLQFIVPFPGIGNDLKLEVPINLCPSSARPPPPTGTPGSSYLTYADVLPAGPPPQMLDLPPTYWAGDDHDEDEKDEKK